MARIGPGGLELGYWLHPDCVGRGIATLAAGTLTSEADGVVVVWRRDLR